MVGAIKQRNADFEVSEDLGFRLSGDGEHDYLLIEKRGANTTWVAQSLARFAGVAHHDVGYAGMKDRRAVTTQWFSVRRPAKNVPDWSRLTAEGVRVLQTTQHRRKLRRGAHSGNRFRIIVSGVSVQGDLEQRLKQVRDQGVPNYFGEQRFGRKAANLSLAREVFAGRRVSRDKRSIALSAARSYLFNRILEERVARGTWNELLPGDCANLDGSASIFCVETVDDLLRRRISELDIHPSGALWGRGPLQSRGQVAELEEGVVKAYPEFALGLCDSGLRQGRRALRLAVRDMSWNLEGTALRLEFSLGRGGYATAVLRELAAFSS